MEGRSIVKNVGAALVAAHDNIDFYFHYVGVATRATPTYKKCSRSGNYIIIFSRISVLRGPL